MWLKLDDKIHRHPKMIAAGRDARDLYIAGLAYAAANLTDGFLPASSLAFLALDAGYGAPIDVDACVAALVEVRLWEQANGGFQIHDYAEYNPSAAEVRDRQAALSASRVAGGQARAATAARRNGRFTSTASADESADYQHVAGTCSPAGDQDPVPDPVHDPDPDPDPVQPASKLARGRARGAKEPDDVWQAVKAQARGRTTDRLEELEALAVERGRGELLAQAVRHTQRQEPRSFWPYLVATIEGCLDTGEIPGNPPPTVPDERPKAAPASRPAQAGPAKHDGLPDEARIAEIEKTDPDRAAWLRDMRAAARGEVATADT